MSVMTEGGGSVGSGADRGAEKHGSVWTRMGGVFYSPQQASEDIRAAAARPDASKKSGFTDVSRWWVPLTAFVLVSILVTAATLPKLVLPEQVEAVRSSVVERGGTAEQADRAVEMSRKFALPMAVISTAVGMFIFAFLVAGVLHLFMTMFGGKGNYKQALAVFSYSLLIPALGSLVKLPMMLARKTLYVETGPTLFFRGLEPSDTLYKFLSGLEVFTLWQLAVLTIGLAVGYRISRGKAGTIVVALWVAALALTARFIPTGGAFGVAQ